MIKPTIRAELLKLVNKWCNDKLNKHFVSDKLTEYFNKKYSLVTDDNEHDLKFCKINFCWKIQKWYVYI